MRGRPNEWTAWVMDREAERRSQGSGVVTGDGAAGCCSAGEGEWGGAGGGREVSFGPVGFEATPRRC